MPYKDKEKQADFIRRSSKNVTVKFVNTTDAELLEWLNNQEHPTTAIKKILREYVESLEEKEGK